MKMLKKAVKPVSDKRFKALKKELLSLADKSKAALLQRFFKTGAGQYGAGDVFLGIMVPRQRAVARRYFDLGEPGIQALLDSPYHEFRLVGLMILIQKYEKASDLKAKKKIVDFYLKNTKRINNWDLVDLSVHRIVGDYLLLLEKAGQKIKDLEAGPFLDRLASSKDIWERRMAVISTAAFIRVGRIEDTLRLSKNLLGDTHDLIHKATGWMLREAGKRVSEPKLKEFLDKHYREMPRTMLRYAIERLSPEDRKRYLSKGALKGTRKRASK